MKIGKSISAALALVVICSIYQPLTTNTANAASVADPPKARYKVLHIMSYHSPWRWTDGLFDGFKQALRDLDVEYRTFQMDTKRNNAGEWKEQKGKEARALIDSWQPDLVYTTDDDAQEYVARYYVNQTIPFVFSGVNKDPAEYGFEGSRNITGVVEHEHFVESVRLLKEIAPQVSRIAVVFDDASMWGPVRQRMQEKKSRLPGLEFVSWDVIHTFAEYRRKVAEYPKTADAIALIGIFNFKDEQGKNVPYQDVLRWTAENSALPDFGFWVDRVHYGTLCAVNVSEYEQGLAAGRIARAILAEGKSPAAFPMKPTVKGNPVISLSRANKLGIRVKSGILLAAEVIQGFEWEKK
ncbi:MAG TPA: ABC transporter substrate binding protein [Deferrimonas sp.]